MNIDKTLIITENDDLNLMCYKVYQNTVNNGWHEKERSINEYCALFHSEVSEFFEEFREEEPRALYFEASDRDKVHDSILKFYENNIFDEIKYWEPLGYGVKIADLVIRLLDFCGEKEIDIYALCEESNIEKDDIFIIVNDLHSLISHNIRLGWSDIEDAIITILSYCVDYSKIRDFDLFEMIRIKHKYNMVSE